MPVSAETDDTGKFTTVDLQPGNYDIELNKTGYRTVLLRIRVPGAEAFTVRLEPLAVIAGSVTDMNGRPLPGSRVRALRKRLNSPSFEQIGREASVDDLGRFRLRGLPAGDYAVLAAYDSPSVGVGFALYPAGAAPHRTRLLSVSAGETQENVDFRIRQDAPSSVIGKVQAEGPDRFRVSLAPTGFPDLVLGSQEVEAGREFRFGGVPSGSYTLVAAGPVAGFTEAGAVLGDRPRYGKVTFEAVGNSAEQVVIPVNEGKAAIVRLRIDNDTAGHCPRVVGIRLRPNAASAAFLPQAIVTLEAGQDRIVPAMPPGTYSPEIVSRIGDRCYLRAVESGGSVLPGAELDISESGTRFTVVMGAGLGGIKGRVLPTGDAVSGGVVMLTSLDGSSSELSRIAYSDSEGYFAFEGLSPGRYRVSAELPRAPGANAASVEVAVSAGQTQVVSLDSDPNLSRPRGEGAKP